jgi:hypothetical protein
MSDLYRALRAKAKRYERKYLMGAISAAEYARLMVLLPYVKLNEENEHEAA